MYMHETITCGPWLAIMSASRTDFFYNVNMVNGIPFQPFITQERMDELKDFALRSDDLFIATFPKSGTTWGQQIIKLLRNDGVEDGTVVSEAVLWLEQRGYHPADELPSPRFFQSHSPYRMVPGGPPHTSPAKYIYIARNPKDVAVSQYHHTRGWTFFQYTGPWDHFYSMFISGRVASGLWFDHVLEWWKHKDDPNVLFLKYEDMKRNTAGAVRKIADFAGYREVKPEVIEKIAKLSSFESMKSNPAANHSWSAHLRNPDEPAFLRKGMVGDWKNHFSAEQSAEFDTLYAERMKCSGLEFEFEH